MCEAGRIRHHIKNNIRKRRSTILIPGFQAAHTLGRRLADGAKKITLFHEKFRVEAEVVQIHGFSGHADQTDLLNLFSELPPDNTRVFLIHGESKQSSAFEEKLRAHGFAHVSVAQRDQRVTLQAQT